MISLLIPLALIVLSIPLVLALLRANEIAYVRVRGGRARLVRGALPPKLMEDLGDVVRAPPAGAAALRIVVEDRRPRIYAEGELTDEQKQRVKNVVGMWPLAKLRAARKR